MPSEEISEWTSDIEVILDKIRQNCALLADYHRIEYLKLKGFIVYFRIPTLVLSAVNSVFSVGLNAFVSQSAVSVLNCMISLTCGIIVSIELYLQVQKRMDTAITLSRDYHILSIDIFKTLSLERQHRKVDSHTYMEHVYGSYTKFKSSSDMLEITIKDSLIEIPINQSQVIYIHPARQLEEV